VSSPDFFPTLLDLASVAPGKQRIDGLSLVPLLRDGQPPAERPLFWHYPHYGNQGGAPGGAVRLGDFKLVEWYEDGRRERGDRHLAPAHFGSVETSLSHFVSRRVRSADEPYFTKS